MIRHLAHHLGLAPDSETRIRAVAPRDGIETVTPGVYRLHYQGRLVEVDDGCGFRSIDCVSGDTDLTEADRLEIGKRVDRMLRDRGEL